MSGFSACSTALAAHRLPLHCSPCLRGPRHSLLSTAAPSIPFPYAASVHLPHHHGPHVIHLKSRMRLLFFCSLARSLQGLVDPHIPPTRPAVWEGGRGSSGGAAQEVAGGCRSSRRRRTRLAASPMQMAAREGGRWSSGAAEHEAGASPMRAAASSKPTVRDQGQ